MSGIPVWLFGMIGGLSLGVIGLFILLPACAKGAPALLKRFVISFLLKLFLVGLGFWIAIKLYAIDPIPLVIGFFVGYIISMFLEILPCIWKLRRCMKDANGTA